MFEFNVKIGKAISDAAVCERIDSFITSHPGCTLPDKIIIGKDMAFIKAYLEVQDKNNCIGAVQVNGKPVKEKDLISNGFFFDGSVCNSAYTAVITGKEGDTYNLSIDLKLFDSLPNAVCDAGVFTDTIKSMCEAGFKKEELLHDIEIMQNNKFPEVLARGVLEDQKHRGPNLEAFESPSYYVPSSKADTYLADAAADLLEGYGVVFSGGQSTGKTKAAMTLADIFGQKIIIETASGSKSWQEMVAPKTTDNSAAEAISIDGAKSFVMYNAGHTEELDKAAMYEMQRALSASTRVITELTPLVSCLENGWWYCMDEMNCCDPNVLESILNPILDNTAYLMIPGVGQVKVHPNFRFIGTQNPGFAGTMEQNQATLSRLSIIDVPYGTNAKAQLMQALQPLTAEGYKVDAGMINRVDELFSQIVKAYKDGAIGDQTISIRGFARAITVSVKQGVSLKNAVKRHVISHANKNDILKLQAKVDLLN